MTEHIAGTLRRWHLNRGEENGVDSHDPRAKRSPKELWLYRNCIDNNCGSLAQERQIFEMIALGAPLPVILNKLCTMINLQVGNVISVVSLPDKRGSHFDPNPQTAIQIGLDVFSSTGIFSRSKTLLGILEIYTCDSRPPAPNENQLIERVARLAAIALQRQKDLERERSSRNSRMEIDADIIHKPPLIN
jgi:hypothetical protein